jgi:gas vesicle protein
MAEKSGNFWGGFFVGAVLGGAVGAIAALKLTEASEDNPEVPADGAIHAEQSRRTLEQKIANLNAAIDAVSQELSTAMENGDGDSDTPERST